MTHATRIGHGLRTKVNIVWLGSTLRLQAREHRLELQPTPEGVMAYFFVDDKEVKKEKVDLTGNPEKLAKEWLDTVGPRPAPEPIAIWSKKLRAARSRAVGCYSSRKFTSMWASTVTGLPSFRPGLKRHLFTASSAFSSSPRPIPFTTLMCVACPVSSTWM